MIKTTTINLAAFIYVPLCIYLGMTGRVDWWVIILIGLFATRINLEI